jgi:hypothetical protein
MCQDSVDDVLFFNTPVRRIGYDSDRSTQGLHSSMSILKTRFSRWAQVIAA